MNRRPLQIKMGFCHLGNRNSHSGHMGNKPDTKKRLNAGLLSFREHRWLLWSFGGHLVILGTHDRNAHQMGKKPCKYREHLPFGEHGSAGICSPFPANSPFRPVQSRRPSAVRRSGAAVQAPCGSLSQWLAQSSCTAYQFQVLQLRPRTWRRAATSRTINRPGL